MKRTIELLVKKIKFTMMRRTLYIHLVFEYTRVSFCIEKKH